MGSSKEVGIVNFYGMADAVHPLLVLEEERIVET